MTNVKARNSKAISLILVLILMMSQFAGLTPAAATPITEIPINSNLSNQTDPAIWGDRVVWQDRRNGNWDIYMFDLSTGQETQITSSLQDQKDPAIYGDIIVWTSGYSNLDIYMYDLSTGIQTQITQNAGIQQYPAIYGDIIVWEDYRNGTADIYMYNISTRAETRVTSDSKYQMDPSIFGDKIVYEDNRNNGNFDIYMYDLSTQVETRITSDNNSQYFPVIFGEKIVWKEEVTPVNIEIFMYDLKTQTKTKIPTIPNSSNRPSIYGNKIVWVDNRDDLYWDYYNSDIYLYDIETGVETQITTNSSEQDFPAIWGDKIVWQDKRNVNSDIFITTLNNTSLPVVSSSDPINGSKNISTNKKITINFSESIQENINFGAITVKKGDTVVDCTYSISGNSLSLKPTDNLEPLSIYTITIPAGAVKDLDGNDLAEDYCCSFTTDNLIRLAYQVTDAVLDPVNPVVYITSKSEKKLYAVNYETGATSVLNFVYTPESLELGQGSYAGELYVALLHQAHSSYWWDEDQSGSIAVIDRDSFSVVDTIYTLVDPYDIVAGRDGHLYVPSGSGQWTNFDSYNRVTKENIHRTGIRQESYALLHPTMERIYTIDTDSSPRDYTAYNILNGAFTDPTYPGGYDSPYHGDYDLTTKFKLDPTGRFIFNGSGNIFTTNEAQEQDMKFTSSLGTGFSDISFEPDLARLYTLSTNTNSVNFYNYDGSSFSYSHNLQLAGKGKYIFKGNGSLVVLTEPASLTDSYKTGIQVINLPAVTATDPAEASIIPLNQNITITFNEEIMAGAAYDSISLKDISNNPVTIDKTISGKILTIDPTVELAEGIVHTVTIPAGAVKNTFNNPLKGEYTLNFSTTLPDVTEPVISSTDPANGVTNLPINQTLTIVFNENVQQDVYFSDINLKNGNTLVGCNYSLNGNTLKITPNTNLAYSTVYTFSIPFGAVKDMANNSLNDGLTFSFTTQAAPSSGGGSSDTTTTAPTKPEVSLSPSITTTTEQKDGQSVTNVTVDENKALETVNQSPTGSTVVIPVIETSKVVSVSIPPGLLVALLNKSSSIEIQTPTGSYLLPAGEINTAKLAKELGVNNADVSINIIISQAKPQQIASIKKFTEQHNLTQLVTPVEFQVEGLAGDKKVEVNNFDSYVSRTIKLSQAVNPATTVGVVANPDGTLSPVPTQFIVVDGKTEAVLKRKTNSTYSVIANKKTFADVKGHWAKEDIDTLASKLIIQGTDKDIFVPENKVSRAEVAALIVRALGLVPQPAKSAFRDVKSAAWYSCYVGSAVEAGIIKGYDDGTFNPNAYATREEVAAMVVRALKVAGVDTAITDTETDQYLAQFSDKLKTSSWAKSSLAVAAKNEIIKGNVTNVLAPANNTTRAELAVMVKRLLYKANFM